MGIEAARETELDMMGMMGVPFWGGAHLTAVELLWD